MKEIIHIISGTFDPKHINGINKAVFQLAGHQAKEGRRVSVWGVMKKPVNDCGETVFETRLFKAQVDPFGINLKLIAAIVARKNDAVFHLHGGWMPVFYALSSLFTRYHIPFVLTPHGAYNSLAMKRNKWIRKLHFH